MRIEMFGELRDEPWKVVGRCTSAFRPFRASCDVWLGAGMCTKADVRRPAGRAL